MRDPVVDELRPVVVQVYPELAGSRFTVFTGGWSSIAIDVDDRLVFKFPKDDKAAKALRMEASVLRIIRPAVTMPVPDMTIVEEPRLFSRHEKLPGGYLLTPDYEALPAAAKDRLAADLALFYSQVHALPDKTMEAAGAGPIPSWLPPDVILAHVLPALEPELRAFAERSVMDWQALPPDPCGETYGFFDGHGKNFAFDAEREVLNGVFDFSDSGFGGLHQEFIYSNWIARDLTARIIPRYEAHTGRALDTKRIELLSGIIRLSEMAEERVAGKSGAVQHKVLADWVGREQSP